MNSLKETLFSAMIKNDINLTENQLNDFDKYAKMLIDWNNRNGSRLSVCSYEYIQK